MLDMCKYVPLRPLANVTNPERLFFMLSTLLFRPYKISAFASTLPGCPLSSLLAAHNMFYSAGFTMFFSLRVAPWTTLNIKTVAPETSSAQPYTQTPMWVQTSGSVKVSFASWMYPRMMVVYPHRYAHTQVHARVISATFLQLFVSSRGILLGVGAWATVARTHQAHPRTVLPMSDLL